jgi:hypothetical protein
MLGDVDFCFCQEEYEGKDLTRSVGISWKFFKNGRKRRTKKQVVPSTPTCSSFPLLRIVPIPKHTPTDSVFPAILVPLTSPLQLNHHDISTCNGLTRALEYGSTCRTMHPVISRCWGGSQRAHMGKGERR